MLVNSPISVKTDLNSPVVAISDSNSNFVPILFLLWGPTSVEYCAGAGNIDLASDTCMYTDKEEPAQGGIYK